MDNSEQRKTLYIATGIFLLGIGYMLYDTYFKPTTIEWHEVNIVDNEAEPPVSFPDAIFVQVSGAVHHPGVFKLNTDDRVLDAIQEAGGPLDTADMSKLNLTVKLKDQMKIDIPFQIILSTTVEASAKQTDGLVSINAADLKMLMTLKGIGKKTAESIISFRETHGPFQRIEELQKVKGIGPKTFERLKPELTL